MADYLILGFLRLLAGGSVSELSDAEAEPSSNTELDWAANVPVALAFSSDRTEKNII